MEAQESLRKVTDSQITWTPFLLTQEKKFRKKNKNEGKIVTQTDIPVTLSTQINWYFSFPHKTCTNNLSYW